MKKIVAVIGVLSIIAPCFAYAVNCDEEYSYENRMKRYHAAVQEEIEFSRTMQKLRLEKEIYVAQLELQKQNIAVVTDVNNGSSSDSKSDSTSTSAIKSYNKEK